MRQASLPPPPFPCNVVYAHEHVQEWKWKGEREDQKADGGREERGIFFFFFNRLWLCWSQDSGSHSGDTKQTLQFSLHFLRRAFCCTAQQRRAGVTGAVTRRLLSGGLRNKFFKLHPSPMPKKKLKCPGLLNLDTQDKLWSAERPSNTLPTVLFPKITLTVTWSKAKMWRGSKTSSVHTAAPIRTV